MQMTETSPAARGYRMPAEWEPHGATWLSWPHNRSTWPGCFAEVEPAMADVVAALAESEDVYINVLGAEHERHVRGILRERVPAERLRFFRVPTNDAWIRDHGAIFLRRASATESVLALDFEFNAWGGKYPPYDSDRKAARLMAQALEVPRFAPGIVLEGGSVDVDGAGMLITTEQCLLNPNRNPALSRQQIEDTLRACFGAQRVIWLGDGIAGDDTDGHVDDLTRFVAPGTVATVVERNADDPNFEPLAANRRRLKALEQSAGGALTVFELPMPQPQYNRGERLPASYANFYVANACVLMPIFACAADDAAREVLEQCFPGRRIVGIDCRALVAGLGALHCLTQQVPVVAGGGISYP